MKVDFPSKDELRLSCQDMPIFPLPNIALIPYTVLRLHVFETRYIELLHDSMKSNRLMAISRLVDNWQQKSPPDVEEIAGIGFVATIQDLPDNRYLIVLIGVGRIHIASEHEQYKLYRRVEGQLMDEASGDCPRFTEMRQLFVQLMMSRPQMNKDLQILLEDDIPMLHMINAVGHILIQDSTLRHQFLSFLYQFLGFRLFWPCNYLLHLLEETNYIVFQK